MIDSFGDARYQPRTFHIRSERSTIWTTSPRFLHQKTLNLPSSIIVKMKKNIYAHYFINKERWNNIFSDNEKNISAHYFISLVIDSFGDARYRSPYFPHRKRALYHLSYIPTILTLKNPKPPVISNCENEKYLRSLFHK